MSIYQFTVKDAQGNDVALKDYEGKVLLIVNTATGCGFTPQYEGLESLYEQYKDQGFEILDFPSNQFLGQAPGTNEEIVQFCQLNYNTQFKTFSKIDVNGENADPLFQYLCSEKPEDTTNDASAGLLAQLAELGQSRDGDQIKWNFTKFLVNREGEVMERFSPSVTPEELSAHIAKLLG